MGSVGCRPSRPEDEGGIERQAEAWPSGNWKPPGKSPGETKAGRRVCARVCKCGDVYAHLCVA